MRVQGAVHVNRIPPRMPVQNYRTFEIRSPLATHYRDASCAEADCDQLANGWLTVADESTDVGQRVAETIRAMRGRKDFIEQRGCPEHGIPNTITCFIFRPGQECFRAHKVPLDRPATFIERDGDWRGNPTRRRRVLRADQWVDDFATHQEEIADTVRRG